jgi:4-amino-4-deoxy-L-arabinose transferase-like glycosyltransferase
MLESGNLIVPTLYGIPHLTKPPCVYVAIVVASWPLGRVSEWTARLPSALAACVTLFLVYWYFKRLLGTRAGLIAAAVQPLSLMWLEKSAAAEIDMLQVAWVTAAILLFLRALESNEKTASRAWKWWLLSLLCVAGGVLTKWTAPVFYYATVVSLLCWRRRLRLLITPPHLVGVAVASFVCMAWILAAIAQVGWRLLLQTLRQEALVRLLPGIYDIPYPWTKTILHPLVLLTASLPWSMLALTACRPRFGRLWDEDGRRLWQGLHCWVWPNVLIWSFFSDHAARHRFPLFPAIAGLAALAWVAWITGKMPWPSRRLGPGVTLVALLICWLVVKVAYVETIQPGRNDARRPRAKGEELARRVPIEKTLYVLPMADRDEGIMFYFGRRAQGITSIEDLPRTLTPVYCLIDEKVWHQWQADRRAQVLWRVDGELRGAMVLIRIDQQFPAV